jgi:regulator of replication initiation timing
MDIDKIITENKILREEIQKLKKDLDETKEHLKKYTAPCYKKEYYEKNKETIKQKVKEYKPTTEQKKKWARNAYLKKKEKLLLESENKSS